MAYAVPNEWAHGDYPTAAQMNKYKTGLDEIYTLTDDLKIHPAVLVNLTTDKGYYFVHRHNWLIYRGDGEIVDPLGAGETVTITGSGANWLAYELGQVEWLTSGKLYEVKDVVACFEDYEAI
jgi:hypothetical protein